MTRATRWLAAIVLAATAPLARAGDDVPRGQLSDDVVPRHYALTLTIDPRQPGFAGVADIDVEITKPTRRIWIHGHGLTVSDASLRVGDRTLPLAYQEVDTASGVARLDLPEAAAGRATLHFAYTAEFHTSAQGLYHVQAGDDWYVFSEMEPIDARTVLPGFDDPRFKTPFEVTVIAPAGDKVVTNGPLASSTPVGDGTVRHRFAPTLPLPTYLLAFAVGPLDIVEAKPVAARTVDRPPLPLRGVATRGQGPKLAYALEHAPAIVLALEDYFRIPFPYPKLDLIASPIHGGAMENAGAILFDESFLLLGDDAPPAQLRQYYVVGAHEIAHQWFGDLVTPAWWEDIWLNESFAQWMGYKVAHQLRPDLVPDTALTLDAIYAMGVDALGVGRPMQQPVDDNMNIGSTFDSITYQKGAGVLSMIESYVGPETFRRGVQRHLAQHANGTATSAEFFANMAAAAGDPGVIEAFRSFVTQPGFPMLTVARKSASQLELSQVRYVPLGAGAPPAERWTIPACIRFVGSLGSRRTCALVSGPTATMAVPVDIGAIETVMPNADGAGYYRFALDDRDAATLLEGAAQLPDREAVMLADSMYGGFGMGAVSLQQMIDTAAALAAHRNWQVSTKPGYDLLEIQDRMLDGPQRAALRTRLAAIYVPRLRAIGASLDAAANAADAPETRLHRRSLVYLVGLGARDPALRRELNAAYVRSLTDPGALDLGLRDRAWTVAVQDGTPGIFDTLVRAAKSDEALARQNASFALGYDDDPATSGRSRDLTLDPAFPSSNAFNVIYGQLDGPDTRAPAWAWLQKNFDALLGRVPAFVYPFTFQLLGVFCDTTSGDEARAFGQAKVRQLGTGELELQRAMESVAICTAQKAAHLRDFEALTAH